MHPLSMSRRLRPAALALAVTLLPPSLAQAGQFRVSSPDLAKGFASDQIFSGFGCTGGNVSPKLVWSGAPKGTKSFVVTVYDPDAPTGSGWWHWVVANIPASTTSIAHAASGRSDLLPAGAREVTNDGGMAGWMGPCPPLGQTHRYRVTVTALNVERLEFPATASPALVGFMTNAAAIGRASFTVRHHR